MVAELCYSLMEQVQNESSLLEANPSSVKSPHKQTESQSESLQLLAAGH